MPRGGRWKTGASASRSGQQAAYRAGLNKGARSQGGEKVDLGSSGGGHSAPKASLSFGGKTQADPGGGSPRHYQKDPGRQTALNKDGTTPEHPQESLSPIRDMYPGDVPQPAVKGAIPDFPGLSKRGSGL